MMVEVRLRVRMGRDASSQIWHGGEVLMVASKKIATTAALA